ncbi:unnamed protein product [Aphis gossypii]|uniref:Uncharacterized protein n=1 Tax=Aphis gossypii TaxID=80765 RepID=A0A9P0IUY2_APHGO|nr:unnamed protein product [Aphis gossypii]
MRSLYMICFSNIFFVSSIYYFFSVVSTYSYTYTIRLSAGGYPSDPTDLDLHFVHISCTGTTHVNILCDLCVGAVFILIILFSYIDCIFLFFKIFKTRFLNSMTKKNHFCEIINILHSTAAARREYCIVCIVCNPHKIR